MRYRETPGRLNQTEYSEIIDPILSSPNGEKEHLHNQLLAAIYGNVTREMPDPGLAPWVSANDKPSTNSGSKAVSGDAAERRLKGEVMQLPARDRRRIKDLVHNEVWAPLCLPHFLAGPIFAFPSTVFPFLFSPFVRRPLAKHLVGILLTAC